MTETLYFFYTLEQFQFATFDFASFSFSRRLTHCFSTLQSLCKNKNASNFCLHSSQLLPFNLN